MHLNSTWRPVLALCMLSVGGSSAARSAVATHCRANEQPVFSCQIEKKVVSLCTSGTPEAVSTVTYRYGAPGKVENEFSARADNTRRFFATASPAKPGTSVNQVWFDRGDVRYLLTECVGGSCSHRAGLAVLRGDKILMNGRCAEGTPDMAVFSRKLVAFGSDAADSHSKTPLLQIEDADNEVVRIYSGRR